LPFRGGEADKTGQGAGHGDDAEHLWAGAAALGAKQQSEAERLVEDAGKGVGGVNGDGGEERVDVALEVALGEGAGLFAEFFPLEEADVLLAQFGNEVVVPAAVLGGDKLVNLMGKYFERLVGAEAVKAGLAVAVFNALHEAGLADFNVFIEIVAGDGEELDALEEGIGGVLGFFKHTPVELHPGVVSTVEELLFRVGSGHCEYPVRHCMRQSALARQWFCMPSHLRPSANAYSKGA